MSIFVGEGKLESPEKKTPKQGENQQIWGSLVRVERSHYYDKNLNESYCICGILNGESNHKWLVQKKMSEANSLIEQ